MIFWEVVLCAIVCVQKRTRVAARSKGSEDNSECSGRLQGVLHRVRGGTAASVQSASKESLHRVKGGFCFPVAKIVKNDLM